MARISSSVRVARRGSTFAKKNPLLSFIASCCGHGKAQPTTCERLQLLLIYVSTSWLVCLLTKNDTQMRSYAEKAVGKMLFLMITLKPVYLIFHWMFQKDWEQNLIMRCLSQTMAILWSFSMFAAVLGCPCLSNPE